MIEKINNSFIGEVGISITNFEGILVQIRRSILEQKRCTITYVNHYIFNLCKKNMQLRNTINNSSIVHSDGVGIWLAAKLLRTNISRFNWTDNVFKFLEVCELERWSLFFYGSTEEILSVAINRLEKLFPNLKVAGSMNGFSDHEDTELIQRINETNSDILWVGLGSPKQELWIDKNSNKLNTKVIQSVGDIFAHLADQKIRGPKIFQLLGFEWLFRLFANPRRMWRRYVIGIPFFIANVLYLFIIGKHEK